MTALISELSGTDLALWVARAEYQQIEMPLPDLIIAVESSNRYRYLPHESWDIGGPLIEKHAIGFHPIGDAEWLAEEHVTGCTGRGPTPLIAAMGALVASVYGGAVSDEVAP